MHESVGERLRERYAEVLDGAMGLSVQVDGDGDLRTTAFGLPVVVGIDAQDPAYLRIYTHLATKRWPSVAAERVGELCATATFETKVAKVVPMDDWILVSVEMIVAGEGLVPDAAHLARVLPRAMRSLGRGAEGIVEQLELAAIEQASDT